MLRFFELHGTSDGKNWHSMVLGKDAQKGQLCLMLTIVHMEGQTSAHKREF